ncbi:hypothetical protein ACHAW6_002232 [Cyclotella cf. meneghiniana]
MIARGRGDPFLRKPIWAFLTEENQKIIFNEGNSYFQGDLPNEEHAGPICHGPSSVTTQTSLPKRHLTLFDLVSIGLGGTIGSGIFVLNGLIAHSYAGPAVFLSWIISGFAALLSGCCYAELSGRIPSTGSSYAYTFVALGELPAFLAAGMLSLEFLLSGSAVARSWGDKVVEWARVQLSASDRVTQLLQPGYNVNPMACLISILATILVTMGIKESKIVTDFFTWIKVLLVLFMTVGGFLLFNAENITPIIPPEFGVSGVLHGAMSSFFGYLGFDAVCCVAGEAINAERNVPLSIMITLGLVTSLYVSASLALVGMQNYTEISSESGYPMAFHSNGVVWASQLTAAGEVITLPVVVLVSLVMQPRLQFALAKDGLLPPIFSDVDSNGNPRKGALFAGILMTVFATVLPFDALDDFISAGILVAFTMTNCSLIIMRRQSPESNPSLLGKLLAQFNTLSFATCLVLYHGLGVLAGYAFASLLGILCIHTVVTICRQCPQASSFGGSTSSRVKSQGDRNYFTTPFVPMIPCLGIFVNYILLCRLSFFGIGLVVLYALLLALFYFLYGANHSIGRREGWTRRHYSSIGVVHENISLELNSFSIQTIT